MPFTVHALRPAAVMPSDPPEFDAAVHLRGRRVVHDTALFPLPFYEGLVVLRFNPRTGPRSRQQVLDRLEGRVIAVRHSATDVADHIVEVGAAWRDSLQHRGLRRLSGEVFRFGYLLQEPITGPVPAVPVDSTLIDLHWDERCKVPTDTAVHRRAVLVSLRHPGLGERERTALILCGRWLPTSDDDGAYELLEVVGTRADVERKLGQMRRLPETGLIGLNRVLSFSGLACP